MADTLKKVKHYKSKSLPSVPVPDAILYIKSDTDTKVTTYITDINGIPYPLKDDNTIASGVQTVFNTDGTISVIGTDNVKISLHSSLLALINSSIQPTDLSTVATSGEYNDLLNIPVDFTPSAHTHPISDVIGLQVALDSKVESVTGVNGVVVNNTDPKNPVVGISGTKAQYNTSLTDGDFLFVGDISQYTDEQAQDSIGTILTDSSTIDFTYDDTTPSILANVKPNSITPTELADNINLTEFVNDAGFETTSQLNVRDTNNRNRVNHTGEQPISTVTGLQTALDSKINTSLIGVPSGVAPLDINGNVPLSNTNDALLGNVKWYGQYDGIIISGSPVVALNGTALPPPSTSNKGWYFISSTTFTNSGKDYAIGDWIISNGIVWDRVDNTDAVSTVFGRVGHVVAINGDYNTSLVPDTLDKRYVTDSNLVTISNQSGVNTGDSSVNITSNAYADSKIEDNIVDGIISKAPSQNAVYDALQLKTNKSSTSIKTGCTISVGSGAGLISVSPGTFVIANNSTGSTVLTPVTFAGVTDVAAIYPRTILYITSSGTLIQFNGALGDLSPTQRRQNLFIGTFAFDGINVLAIQNTPNIDYDISQRFNDLTQTLGVRNSEGNVLTANGANLMINKTSGRTFRHMSNYQIDKNIPDITTDSAAIPIPSGINLLAYRDGLGGWAYESYSGSITPTFWDDGTGVKATVANNKFTIPRVYFFNGTDTYIVYLGQKEYGSIDAAISDADRSDRVIDPATSLSSYRGGIAVEKSVTDLQAGIIANTVRFIAPPSNGSGVGSGTVSTQNLQGVYNNSVNPEITTDATRGGLTVRNGQVSDASSVLEGQNIAGSTTFRVTGNGNITGGTYNGYIPENVVNKVTDIAVGANNTTYPTSLAVKTYADNLVVGMLNDRGSWDASVNLFPTTGGSGAAGAIRKGDMWYVSISGTLGGKPVNVGDSFRALVNAPAQTSSNWSVLESNIGYVPANDLDVVHLFSAGSVDYLPKFDTSGSVVNSQLFNSSSVIALRNNNVVLGIDNSAGSYFTNVTGGGSLPSNIQGIQAGVGIADLRLQGSGGKLLVGGNTGDIYMVNGQLNSQYSSDFDANLNINYSGYLGGTTRYRGVNIYNGKQFSILGLDGTNGELTLSNLSGTGTRLVTADASGTLSTDNTDYLPLSGGTVSGTITASPATVDTQLATLGQAKAVASSGTYTPTLTAVTNCSALTVKLCSYTKIGNIVNLSIRIQLQETTDSVSTSVRITLPINKTSTIAETNIGAGVTSNNIPIVADFIGVDNGSFVARYVSSSSAGTRALVVNLQYSVAE